MPPSISRAKCIIKVGGTANGGCPFPYHKTKKSRQQLQILYEYLNCDRKLTEAANKLGMHRNNILYHIRQMEDCCHLDLDDPEMRLKLLISFELLKYKGEIF